MLSRAIDDGELRQVKANRDFWKDRAEAASKAPSSSVIGPQAAAEKPATQSAPAKKRESRVSNQPTENSTHPCVEGDRSSSVANYTVGGGQPCVKGNDSHADHNTTIYPNAIKSGQPAKSANPIDMLGISGRDNVTSEYNTFVVTTPAPTSTDHSPKG